MLETVTHALPVQFADWAYQQRGKSGFQAGKFVDGARRKSGLSDLGSGAFETGLSVLCDSMNQVDLNIFGHTLFSQVVHSALVHRLLRVQYRKDHPEVFDQPLNAPVIVVGLPRSGTTALHRLLALSDNARALKTWEVRGPIHGRGVDLRRVRARALVGYMRRYAGSIDKKHMLDADGAEECVFLLEDSFCCVGFWMFFPVFDYLKWLLNQDMSEPYEVYREYLQIFQAQTPDRRLVLKAPAHLNYLSELTAAVPEATIVHTHRDPVPVVGSVNSLFHTLFSVVSQGVEIEEVGEVNLALLAKGAGDAIKARQGLSVPLVDVNFSRICTEPRPLVEELCEQTGLHFNTEKVRSRTENHSQHSAGKHEYDLNEAGLTHEQVNTAFVDYNRLRTKLYG